MGPAAFLAVAAAHLVAAMSPGPSFVVCVRTAVTQGFRPAVALSAGFGAGAVLWAFSALAGLALLFELVPSLFTALRLVGGAFLVFIAVMMWRHAPEPLEEPDAAAPTSAGAAFRLGFLTFAANPKTAVFFGAVFVGLVPPNAGWPALALLLAVIFANETLWYIVVARVFSMPRARAAYARAKTWTDRLFGSALGLLGIKVALG
ncbi:LysE family translocator [Histidinibacterium aquaticum]|uniref:LysE family translocator n=1 Tax=Histidinibacterium aquaticum TaxID=2613962 RepID=A0A5J5GL53_9RHOB|nr:LysE family transporter [Histidinibacterium aquaticum]KAA9009056.1 LysE family translocator [Histidinibacterium aquaticum]